MQVDGLASLLKDTINAVAEFEKLEHKLAPELAQLKHNCGAVDPSLLAKLDETNALVAERRRDLERLKSGLRDEH